MLDGVGQVGKRERGARKKDQRQPDNLVEHLSLLHGVGDAGDHEAERAEGNRSDGDQNCKRKKITETRNMKDETRQEYFNGNRRKREHVVCQEAGGKHVRGRDRRDVEAAQNPLFAENHERGAESPETAHHVESDDGAEEITDGARIAAGKNAGVKKKHAEGEDHAEEEKHFVTQGKQNARAGQTGKVAQSRSLLPVISMKTSSSEGVAISRLTSSLPPASRCLTSETMVCGGRLECST